jgi:hypothetical protein
MSLDYKLFLRERPDLASFVYREAEYDADGNETVEEAGHPGLEQEDEELWTFGGFLLQVDEYVPDDDDAIGSLPWRDEITWVITAGGGHTEELFDEFFRLMSALGERYRGALWGDVHNKLFIYWWDRDALASDVRRWLSAGDADALVALIETARGDRKAPALQPGDYGDGPLEQVAEIVLADMGALTKDVRARVLGVLGADKTKLGDQVRGRVVDAIRYWQTA